MRHRVLRWGALVGIAACSSVGSVGAEDWPQWRGPERDGVWRESGVLSRFPDAGLSAVWRAPVGSGYAGPAVAGGRVFVLDWEKDAETRVMGGQERLHAFDERTGEVLWSISWPASYASIMASYAIGPRATPTVDGDRVFALGAVGDLLAVDVATGEVAWRRDFVEEYDASVPIWGTSSSPLVVDDLVIAVAGAEPDGKVVAYDKASGEERWRAVSSDWEMGYEQPVLIEAGGRRQLIIWEPKGVFSLDPESGREHWSVPWEVGQGMTVATPVVDGSHLLLTQFYRGSLMLRLAEGRPGADTLWVGAGRSEMPDRTEGLHSLITTPVMEEGTIYGVGSYGELRGLDAATGERLWADDRMTRQGRWGAAFMVKNGDRWFVNNDQGDLIIASFTREGYVELDRTRLIEPTSRAGYGPRRMFDASVNWSHPAYANLHVVARNDREVARFALAAP